MTSTVNLRGVFSHIFNPTIDFETIKADPLCAVIHDFGIGWGFDNHLSRRNFFNNTAVLSTQTITIPSWEYTLSFKGTGTITLSSSNGTTFDGNSSVALVGTGEEDRVSVNVLINCGGYGTVTATVSGTVQEAQIAPAYLANASVYQPITDWAFMLFSYAAAQNVPYLRRNMLTNTVFKTGLTTVNATYPLVIPANLPSEVPNAIAAKITEDSTDGEHSLRLSAVTNNIASALDNLRFTVFLCAAERSKVVLTEIVGSGNSVTIDLSNGTLSDNTLNATIAAAGVGWYKVTVIAPFAAAGSQYKISLHNGTSTSYAGTTGGVYICAPMQTVDTGTACPYQEVYDSWQLTYALLSEYYRQFNSCFVDQVGIYPCPGPGYVVGLVQNAKYSSELSLPVASYSGFPVEYASITSNPILTGQIDPDGGTTGYGIIEKSTNSPQGISQASDVPYSSATHVLSGYFKVANNTETRYGVLQLGSIVYLKFNLETGEIKFSDGAGAKGGYVVPVGNGWFFAKAWGTGTATTVAKFLMTTTTTGMDVSEAYTGDDTTKFLFYGIRTDLAPNSNGFRGTSIVDSDINRPKLEILPSGEFYMQGIGNVNHLYSDISPLTDASRMYAATNDAQMETVTFSGSDVTFPYGTVAGFIFSEVPRYALSVMAYLRGRISA